MYKERKPPGRLEGKQNEIITHAEIAKSSQVESTDIQEVGINRKGWKLAVKEDSSDTHEEVIVRVQGVLLRNSLVPKNTARFSSPQLSGSLGLIILLIGARAVTPRTLLNQLNWRVSVPQLSRTLLRTFLESSITLRSILPASTSFTTVAGAPNLEGPSPPATSYSLVAKMHRPSKTTHFKRELIRSVIWDA